jgi:hypothetical protein
MPKMLGLFIIPVTVFIVVLSACSAESGEGGSQNSLGGTKAGGAGAGGAQSSTGSSDTGGVPIWTSKKTTTQAGTAGDDPICADVNVTMSRSPINLILVVDRSETMALERFGNVWRWDAVRTALFDENTGLVKQYQESVRFGYEGFTGFPGTTGNCPDLMEVSCDLNNYSNILFAFDDSHPADIIATGQVGQTPTGESLQQILNNLEPLLQTGPDQKVVPYYLLIATDGQPDTCADPNTDGSPAATQLVVDQVARAFQLGVKTFILSVGSDTSDAHLQDVANAGVGNTGGGTAPFWKPGDSQGLSDALSAIIGGALSCKAELTGTIADKTKACQLGKVTLNGNPITCNDQDGWRVVDDTHIELVGNACTQLKSSPAVVLSGSFPCGSVLR